MKLMTKLGLTLVLLSILTACNPDATGVKSDAPPAVSAPAAAPPADAAPKVPERTAPMRSESSTLSPEEMREPPAGDPFAIGKAGPGRKQPPVAAPEKSTPALETPAEKVVAPVVFSVRKTPCYGDCQVYALTLHEDGTLAYDGKQNVRRKGKHERALTTFEYRELVGTFNELKAGELAEIYPEDVSKIPTDVPFTVLTFPTATGEEKTVTVYFDAPEALQAFLDELTQTITKGIWTRV
ncbi:MAG: DUF6438 domain-containing protein [Bacteroidota bacterium]